MSGSGYDKTLVLSRSPVEEPPPHAARATLRCVDTSVLRDDKGAEIHLERDPVSIGRGEENVVALNAHGISRSHARVFLHDGTWHVEDLGSTNGTRVNNSKIERTALHDGDTVAFGRVCYKYQVAKVRPRPASSHEIDLGAAQKTMVMRPGELHASSPTAAHRDEGHAGIEDTGRVVHDTGSYARVARDTGSHPRVKPAAATSNNTLWLLVALVAVGIAAGAAYALGFL